MRIQSTFFNTYQIIKTCWVILFFNLIGYLMFAELGQGRDVLRALGFHSNGNLNNAQHTIMLCFLMIYWGWQNWRSARIITHFKSFHFSEFYKSYQVRTLVIIPRLFALLPFLIIIYGTYKANNAFIPLMLLYVTLGFWLYVFLLYRRKFIVYLMAKNFPFRFLLDYIPVKNDAYPISFLILKQRWWILQRIVILILTFALIIIFPISFSRLLGSCGLVMLAISSWMMFFTLLSLFEHRFKIPFVFLLFSCWFVFSFFNNNHAVRVIKSVEPENRMYLDTYINHWLQKKNQLEDTVNIYLVACEGGGIRAAYWTNEVLSELSLKVPDFKNDVLAFSSVSGSTLGTVCYNLSDKCSNNPVEARHIVRNFLKNDFLSPIMGYAMFPDAMQRFLPFPVAHFDRAAILEKTWENGWEQTCSNEPQLFKKSYLENNFTGTNNQGPLLFFNATHIETGKRVLISPVKFGDNQFYETTDLLDVMGKDLPLSSAVLLSARFPYVTPAGLVYDKDEKKWGHVGDGGYYENLGISTLLEVYTRLRTVSDIKEIPIKVTFILIRNTKDFSNTEPLGSMYEMMAPIEAYLNVWYKGGGYNFNMIKNISLKRNDKILNFALPRFENDIIPLGWSLSRQATDFIDSQVENVVETELKRK
ncbi:MAG: hypothetical protein ACKVQB_10750 [Bacteroidia bacterium]